MRSIFSLAALGAFLGLTQQCAETTFDQSYNYVQNGGFENPCVGQGWSIFPSATVWTEKINQIEIGYGPIYNSGWTTQICELDANVNSDIKQNVQLNWCGHYQISFDYAARQGQSFQTCELSVWWNGKQVHFITPNDYNIHHAHIIVHGHQGLNTLEFRGEGASDSYGAGIDNVSLYGQLHTHKQDEDSQEDEGDQGTRPKVDIRRPVRPKSTRSC